MPYYVILYHAICHGAIRSALRAVFIRKCRFGDSLEIVFFPIDENTEHQINLSMAPSCRRHLQLLKPIKRFRGCTARFRDIRRKRDFENSKIGQNRPKSAKIGQKTRFFGYFSGNFNFHNKSFHILQTCIKIHSLPNFCSTWNTGSIFSEIHPFKLS